MASTKRGRPARTRFMFTGLCLTLAACGGGDKDAAMEGRGDTPGAEVASAVGSAGPAGGPQTSSGPVAGAEAPAAAAAPAAAVPMAAPVLDPLPPELVASTLRGEPRIKAVGALDDGGHVVVWVSHEPGDPATAWPLWLQRFDDQGRKAGPAVRLVYPQDVDGPDDVAVTVLPEGRIGVVFVTDRLQDIAFGVTEVHYWPFNLAGAIDGTTRVLESQTYTRGYPRAVRLDGPLVTAVGRDGSQYIAWHNRAIGFPPLIPSLHSQRLAADGAPLGWIQRLDGEGGVSQIGAVRLTPLDEGGWVVEEERTPAGAVHFTTFDQLDVARPLALPDTVPYQTNAFLLDLRGHGSVFFGSDLDPATGTQGATYRIHFTRRGDGQPARPLARIPESAVALTGGDYLTLDLEDGHLQARRFTPAGDPVGPAFPTEATTGALGAGLRRGALALAWIASLPNGEVQVLSQRFAPRQP